MNEQSNRSRRKMTALVVACILFWYGAHIAQGRLFPFSAPLAQQFSCLGTSVSLGCLLVFIYTRWLWKIRLLHPWFEDTPMVFGTYEGRALRFAKDGIEDKRVVYIRVVVTQPTVDSIFFLQTALDKSAEGYTEACQLVFAEDRKYYLDGIYQLTKNERHAETEGRTEIYFGAMRLELDNPVMPLALNGSYWSSHFTRGRVELSRKK